MDIIRVMQRNKNIITLLLKDIQNRIKNEDNNSKLKLCVSNIISCSKEINNYLKDIKKEDNSEKILITGARDFGITLGNIKLLIKKRKIISMFFII
jgi:hypothetical protein